MSGYDPVKVLKREIAFVLISIIYINASVLLFWNETFLLSALLITGLAAIALFRKEPSDIVVMITAALLGTPTEMYCVSQGVWTYKAPHLMLGVPLWLPFVWAYLFCFFRITTHTITSLADHYLPYDKSPAQKTTLASVALLAMTYSAYTLTNIIRPIALVYFAFLCFLLLFCRKREDLVIFTVGAVCGTLGEYLCMRLGYWQYHFPFFKSIGLPLSLPLAWGLSSVIISRVAEVLSRAVGLNVSSAFDRK